MVNGGCGGRENDQDKEEIWRKIVLTKRIRLTYIGLQNNVGVDMAYICGIRHWWKCLRNTGHDWGKGEEGGSKSGYRADEQ